MVMCTCFTYPHLATCKRTKSLLPIEVLRELVALKKLKDDIEAAKTVLFIDTRIHNEKSEAMLADYLRRKPIAWAAAFAVVELQ